jgi:hypothetical protein
LTSATLRPWWVYKEEYYRDQQEKTENKSTESQEEKEEQPVEAESAEEESEEELGEESDDEEQQEGYEDSNRLVPKLVIKDESEYQLDKDYAKKVQDQRAQLGAKKWEVSEDELDIPEPQKPEALEGEGNPERLIPSHSTQSKQGRIKEALGKAYKKDVRVKYVQNQPKSKGFGKEY